MSHFREAYPRSTGTQLGTLQHVAVQDEEHIRADALRNRAALLDAAADVLAIAPQASLSEVATRAGLGRATLYRHFDSRDALRAAIREEALSRAAAALAGEDLRSCDTREALRRAAAVLVPLGMRFRILLTEGSDADPGFLAARNEALAPLWEVLARGVEAGEVTAPTSTAWLGMVLAGLLMSAVRAADAGLIDPTDAGDLVANSFLDGFGRG
jgi:AcrR family transcriptional regulator